MNTNSKEKTPNQIKREEKNEKLGLRRLMHKFQDRWKVLNIKFSERDIDRKVVIN
jgi:hypothetical protein